MPVDHRLVGLEVQRQRGVRDDLGMRAASRAELQVTQTRLELARVERREAEVVEEILAVLEVGELVTGDEQQHRAERRVALAQCATHRERRLRFLVGADDGARPPLRGLLLGRDRTRSRPPSTAGPRGRGSGPAARVAGPGTRAVGP